MESKEEVAKRYDFLAREYDEGYQSGVKAKVRNEIIFATLKSIVSGRKCKILDAGGGTGFYSFPMALKHEVFILDISGGMLREAREKGKMHKVSDRIVTIRSDMENMCFLGENFDVVLCHLAFSHLSNPIGALNEFNRVLKKEGILSLVVENKAFFSVFEAFKGDIQEALKRLKSKQLIVSIGSLPKIRAFEKQEIINMCSAAGFKTIKVIGLGITDYLQLCWKEPIKESEELLRLEKELAEAEGWNSIGRFLFMICKKVAPSARKNTLKKRIKPPTN